MQLHRPDNTATVLTIQQHRPDNTATQVRELELDGLKQCLYLESCRVHADLLGLTTNMHDSFNSNSVPGIYRRQASSALMYTIHSIPRPF